jgi:type I restriction enzyme, S subunit
VSELPKGWTKIQLGSYIEVIRGASPRPKGDPRYFGGDIPWISIKDINSEPGKYLTRTMEGVTEDGAEKSRLLEAGTLILSNSGSVCIPKILGIPGCIHDGFVAFPSLEFDIDYFYHLFDWMRPSVIAKHRQGVTQVNLNIEIVKSFEIPLPPLNEQKRIADRLDLLLTRIDKAKTHLDRIPPLLKRFRQSVLAIATSGKLTEDWREANGLDFTKMWKYAPVSSVGEVFLGRQRSPKNHHGENMRPYMRAANITWQGWNLSDINEMNFDEKDFERYKLKFGDVLINEGSGSADEVGKPAIWRSEVEDCCFQNTLICVRPYKPISEYLYFIFLNAAVSKAFVEETQGVNIYHIGKERFAAFIIPVPPPEEQAEIVRRVEALFAKADRLEAQYKTARQQTDRLTPALLAKAFRGQLVPQDPTDEPASALLERIRQQRDASPEPKKKRIPKRSSNKVAQPKEIHL